MPAVHRDEVDVEIDEQVALDRTLVYAERFVVPRMSERDEIVVVLGVVVVVAVRVIFVEDIRADHPLHFPLGHLAVKRVRDDQVNVVDAVRTAHIEHYLEHRLPHIGRRHRRQRQRNVVHRDRHPHSRFEQSVQRFHLKRMIYRITNRRFAIRQPLDRRIRIDHPRPDREVLKNKVLAERHDPRCGVFVDVHDRFVCLAS